MAAATNPRFLIDGDHYGSPHLPDCFRKMPLPVHVFDQNNFTNGYDASFAVTSRNLVWRIQVDDVLAPRCRVPIEKPIGLAWF
jgi:hypothetical protein